MVPVVRRHTARVTCTRRATTLALSGALLLAAAGCAGDAAGSATDAAPDEGPVALELAEPGSAADEPAPSTAQTLPPADPDEYSVVGDLVDGFPIELLPVPRDAVILVTSAVPVGDAEIQEVSLNLRTSATATDLLELYRAALTDAGFTEVPTTSASDLAVDVSFTRSGGDELVTIGVLDVDGARTVTIGGRVHTES